jgi:trehalose/maltose hydrolase-like predicted phosphorylase
VAHVAVSNGGIPANDLVLSPCTDAGWLLIEEGLSPAREREIESLLAIGNGYLGVRTSIGGRFSHPATFIAGIYVGDGDLGPRLAVFPQWLNVAVTVENEELTVETGRVLLHRWLLDLSKGVLWREWRQQHPSGRITRLTCFQLASLADRRLLLQSVTVTAENYAGTISVGMHLGPSGTHGNVENVEHADVELVAAEPGAVLLRAVAKDVGIAAASKMHGPGAASWKDTIANGEERCSWKTALGQTMRLDRILAVFTSRDSASPLTAARQHLAAVCARGFQAAIADHVDAWRRRWDSADVRIVGDKAAQHAMRFAIYHLIAAANPADECVSIASRGLTGEAYRGHVLWDTEIYMLPFYVFTAPEAARALLMYRCHTLDLARRKAQALGYQGALYAWESADTGDEVTPQSAVGSDGRPVAILTGQQEHHISADIAFAVWQYWRATADNAFMAAEGAEILVETARFWASRAQIGLDRLAHVRRVIGPDEYHETVDDNAYTNVMAIFNLERAADVLAMLERNRPDDWQRLSERLRIDAKEPQAWRSLAAKMVTGFDRATGLFEQFAGYFQLEEIDPAAARNWAMPIDVRLGAERVRRSRIIKQADVVALSALRWKKWPVAVHEANFRFYEPRTAHGSSLSPAIHALVAARLGDLHLAQTYFRQAAEIDLTNNMGNAAAGVHMGALGGLWQAAVFGMAGVQLREDGISVDPHLLPSWSELAFPLQWRGRRLRLRFEAQPRRIEAAVEGDGEVTVAVRDGPACCVRSGQNFALQDDGSGWGHWEEAGR